MGLVVGGSYPFDFVMLWWLSIHYGQTAFSEWKIARVASQEVQRKIAANEGKMRSLSALSTPIFAIKCLLESALGCMKRA